MKRFLSMVALGLITLSATGSFAQSRDIGARRLKLDDGAGGVLTIEYAGPGSGTFIFPTGSSTTVALGTVAGQTLRWNGTNWVASSILMNDGTNVSIPTGNLNVTLGTISGNGSGLTALNATNVSTGTLNDARLSSNVALRNNANNFSVGQVVNATGSSIGTAADAVQLTVNGPGAGAALNTLTVNGRINAAGAVVANSFTGNGAGLTALTGANVVGNIPGNAANVTGVVVEANGGTGFSTYAIGDMLYASAANDLSKRTIGAAGDVLTVSGGVPVWQAPGGVTTITGTANQIIASAPSGAVTLSLANPINVNTTGNAANVTGVVAITNGGTGATTAPLARTALGLGTIATQDANNVSITGGSVAGSTVTGNIAGNAANVTGTVAIANGGTGATTAPLARTALGLGTIATQDANNVSITGGSVAGSTVSGNIAGNAANVTGTVAIANGGTGATTAPLARTALGLGTIATQDANNVSITGGSVAGSTVSGNIAGNAANVTGVVVEANGGTGFSTYAAGDLLYASAANDLSKRAIGANGNVLTVVAGMPTWQAPAAAGISAVNGDANITANTVGGVVGLTLNNPITVNTTGTAANVTGTVAIANGGTGATTAPLARTALGLGTIATQDANNVAITGGTIGTETVAAVAFAANDVSFATASATGNTLVRRDASANFAGNDISAVNFFGDLTGNVTGNATNVTGIVAIANGGTGATTAPLARTALGLGTIATQDANNVSITGGSVAGSSVTGNIAGNAANVTGVVAIANGGTGAITAPLARTALGLGTIATQDANNVSITGGSVAGSTVTGNIAGNAANVTGTVAVANGGTGRTSVTANALLVGNGAGVLNELAAGSNTQVLTIVAGAPAWAAAPGGGSGGSYGSATTQSFSAAFTITTAMSSASTVVILNDTDGGNEAITMGDGTTAGQLLVLIGDPASVGGATIPDDANTRLSGNFTIGPNDAMTLMWNGSDWIELSRSAN